jgi:hypothetical protein
MWAVEEVYGGRAQRWEFATEALAAACFYDLRFWWMSGMAEDSAEIAKDTAGTGIAEDTAPDTYMTLGGSDYLRLVAF